MNKYLNPDTIAEALAAGHSADEIAQALTEALNEAIGIHKAEQEKKEKENKIAEAEDNLVAAINAWMALVFPSYKPSEEDTKTLKNGFASLRNDLAPVLALLDNPKSAKFLLPIEPTKKPNGDILSKFLAENGLM